MATRTSNADKPPPYDKEAEEGVLGAILLSENVYEDVRQVLGSRDFFSRRHKTIWRAIETAAKDHGLIDATTVLGVLRDQGMLDEAGGGGMLIHLKDSCTSSASGPVHATRVAKLGRRRRVLDRTREISMAAYEGDGYKPAIEQLLKEVTAAERNGHLPEGLIDLWELCMQEGDEYDWLIDGLLEREARLILYGEEGGGKSLLSLQAAVQAASGLPVLGRFHVPAKLTVLYVDLEVPKRSIRRRGRQFMRRLDIEFPDGLNSVPFFTRPDGIDLNSVDGKSTLEQVIAATLPDLVVIDPLYKAFTGELMYEKDVKPTLVFLDRLRTEFRCGMWIVHHPRKSGGDAGGAARGAVSSDLFGSSVLLRWPELLMVMTDRALIVQKIREDYFTKGQEIGVRKGMLEVKKGGSWIYDAYDGPVMKELHDEIREHLEREGPMSASSLATALAKRKKDVLDACRELIVAGEAHPVDPPSGKGWKWYAPGNGGS